MFRRIAIIGSSGAIGSAWVDHFKKEKPKALIHAFSRTLSNGSGGNVMAHQIEDYKEESIQAAASLAAREGPLDLVVVTDGMGMKYSLNEDR